MGFSLHKCLYFSFSSMSRTLSLISRCFLKFNTLISTSMSAICCCSLARKFLLYFRTFTLLLCLITFLISSFESPFFFASFLSPATVKGAKSSSVNPYVALFSEICESNSSLEVMEYSEETDIIIFISNIYLYMFLCS